MTETQRFKGKVIIVTGAASGIGRGIAERFSAEGASLVLADVAADKLAEVGRSFAADQTLLAPCDVSSFDEVRHLVQTAVQRFGGLDVMVNNAGIASEGDVLEVSLDDWNRTVRTDLDSVFYGCRAALPELIKRGGCIVNTASVSGLGGDWKMAAYNAAKGGVVNLTRAVAMDFASKGVRVNAVCPSLTRTGMTEDMITDEKLVAKFKERIPQRRYAEPADIAAVVAFLASDEACFVNGVNLPVDGGLSASNGQPAM